jgi:hypothetical protein
MLREMPSNVFAEWWAYYRTGGTEKVARMLEANLMQAGMDRLRKRTR